MAMVRNNQDEMSRQGVDPDPEQGRRVLAAAFRMAVRNHFPAELDLRDVGGFIVSVRGRVPQMAFKIIDAEFLVREACGEDLDVSGIDVDTQSLIHILLFGEVVWAGGLADDEVAALLVAAERSAAVRTGPDQ
jgi:hypothetical protein